MIRKLALTLLLLTPLSLQAHAQDKNPSFTLVNKSSQPIRELFVTPSGDANWGQNRLTTPVAPGANFAVRRRIDGNCVFDLRVVYGDSTREERRTVNTCTAEDIPFAGTTKAASSAPATTGKAPDDPSFRLTNHNKQPIAELYAGPKGEPRGPNLLDKGALPPDASTVVKPPRGKGCSLELRVVFADKTAKTRTTDLCKITELSVP
jgi:hypothetical protein